MKDVARLVAAVILVCQLPPVPKTAPARDFGRKHQKINGGDGDDNDDNDDNDYNMIMMIILMMIIIIHHHHHHNDCHEDSSCQRFQQNYLYPLKKAI